MNLQPLKIVVKPEDYRWGDGQLQAKLTGITLANWLPHLEFFVPQTVSNGDTDDCWDFGATKHHDAFMDALISNNLLPKSVTDWFTSVGFMDMGRDGLPHFHSSERWAGVLSGDGQGGGWPAQGYDIFRKQGVVPFTKLPVMKGMTLAEYFDPTAITQELKDIGMQFLTLMGGKDYCQYQWIVDGGATNIPLMAQAILSGPLDLGIPVDVSGWNQLHPTVATGQAVHVVTGYQIVGDSVYISDNYSPFLKILDPGYQMSFVMQMILQYIPPPPPVPLPPPPITNTVAVSSWLDIVKAWAQNWLERLTPQGRAKLGGASRSPLFAEAKKKYFETHLKMCAGCDSVKGIQVHHIKDFSDFPELELSLDNYLLLCEGTPQNCHLNIGHSGNFKSINPNSVEDAKKNLARFRNRPVGHQAKVDAFSKVAQTNNN